MHVIVTTDGSKQSLAAARRLKSFADPAEISDPSVVAVIRPLAAVAFADQVSESEQRTAVAQEPGLHEAAQAAPDTGAAEFDGWGPQVHTRLRSGSPAQETIKAAKQLDAALVVIAGGGRGLSDTVLPGSTAQRAQQFAPRPVLVVRPSRKR